MLNTQHIYKLQQYIIPLLLLSAQRTMNRGILNKKSLGPFRPVKARGPGFSGPVRPVSARLGPRAGPRFAISSMYSTIRTIVVYMCTDTYKIQPRSTKQLI